MPDSRMVRSTVGCPFDDLVMRGFAVAYAFGVQERRRCMSRGRGRRPRPLCHGVSTARGSGTSIRRHTACSWAPSDPWCGTLNTDACPDGRSRLARTRFQPCLARSEPSSTEKFPASTQSATAASLGVNVGTLRLDCPAPGIRDPVPRSSERIGPGPSRCVQGKPKRSAAGPHPGTSLRSPKCHRRRAERRSLRSRARRA